MYKALVLALLCVPAWALAQYKVVDAGGRVTYTDRPPANTAGSKVTEVRRGGLASADNSLAALPIELRLVAQRYPVLLYTTNDCAPCVAGRQLLTQRGIPFNEKRLATEEDVTAAERALGWRTVPSLSIGTQTLRGLAPDEWQAYLDAAGYPKESRLPRTYQQAAPAPAATLPGPNQATPTSNGGAGVPPLPAPPSPQDPQ